MIAFGFGFFLGVFTVLAAAVLIMALVNNRRD